MSKQKQRVAAPQANGALLKVQDLGKFCPIKGGLLQETVANVRGVDGVSFEIKKGETLGLIGESGSGKSTVARTIMRLIPPTSGEAWLEGRSIFKAKKKELHEMRREVQIIFQDPYGSLNPRMSVGEIVGEGLLVHGVGSAHERDKIVSELLEVVGRRGQYRGRFPHEFSGGQRQRIRIGLAHALRPKLIIDDVPDFAAYASV